MTVADEIRERGLQVGDTIEGRSEGHGSWRDEARLTLLWVGNEVAVWSVQTRNVDRPQWDQPRESASWELGYRNWRKVKE